MSHTHECDCGGCAGNGPGAYPCVGCSGCGKLLAPIGDPPLEPLAHDMVMSEELGVEACTTCFKTQEQIDATP